MKWMLVIFVVISADDVDHRTVMFDSKKACAAAGEAFIDRFPGFEWHDPGDETAIETPVARSHVRCVPAGDGIVEPMHTQGDRARLRNRDSLLGANPP